MMESSTVCGVMMTCSLPSALRAGKERWVAGVCPSLTGNCTLGVVERLGVMYSVIIDIIRVL